MATATKKTPAKKAAPAKATTTKKAAAKKAPAPAPAEPKKPTPKKKPAAPATPGVRAGRTRAYLAGQIIKKHGITAGVTDAMVAELDEAYGKANPTESRYRLSDAWHAARGFAGLAENAVS